MEKQYRREYTKGKVLYIYVFFFLIEIYLLLWGGLVEDWEREQNTIQNAIMGRRDKNQRTNGPVNAHLISWPSKAQNKQNLENIW